MAGATCGRQRGAAGGSVSSVGSAEGDADRVPDNDPLDSPGDGNPVSVASDGPPRYPGLDAPVAAAPPEPVPAPERTHRWGLGAFLLAEVIFLGTTALVAALLLPQGGRPLSAEVVLVLLTVPPLVAAATALLVTRLRGNGPRRDLGLVWSWRDLGLGLAFGLGGLFLTGIASAVFVAIVGPDVSSTVGDVFEGLRAGPVVAALVLVAVVVVVPFCEEVLYRGLLWGGLERLGANRWLAFGVTTVIFALFHFELTRAPLLLVIAVPLGLARLVTGRLLASVVAHQVNNLLPGIVLMLGLLGQLPPG